MTLMLQTVTAVDDLLRLDKLLNEMRCQNMRGCGDDLMCLKPRPSLRTKVSPLSRRPLHPLHLVVHNVK